MNVKTFPRPLRQLRDRDEPCKWQNRGSFQARVGSSFLDKLVCLAIVKNEAT
jgi:hypothetical protein